MRLSVVLANYNGAEFLGEAIQGVLKQDYQDLELLVVDDGSTDTSRQIIREHAEREPERVRPIFLAENRGQGEAFNVGVAQARGQVVSFLDSDDVWFPGKLAAVRQAFQKQPELAIFQHNLYLIRDGQLTHEHCTRELLTGDVVGWTRQTCRIPSFVPTSGLSFSKAVLDRVLPIPKGFCTCADGFLTRTAMCFGEVGALDECLGGYRLHPANNVVGNPHFDMSAYFKQLLFPALNRFFEENGVSLRFPIRRWPNRALGDRGLSRVLRKAKSLLISKPHS